MFTLIGTFTTLEVLSAKHEFTALNFELELASNMLMWTTLYLVKATFLALTWNIFEISAGFRKAWWAVTVYTFLTFWPDVLSELWACGSPADYASPQACVSANVELEVQRTPIYFRFALHLSTECFILVLPIAEIRKMHMPLAKKISVAAVFALIVIDIIAGIVRSVVTMFAANGTSVTDIAYEVATICSVIEPAIAVLVCSLPPYRALVFKFRFRKNGDLEPQHNVPTIGARRWRLPKPFRLLSASIPSPFLSISILREQPPQSTSQYSSTSSIDLPGLVHVVPTEEEKRHEEVS